MLMQRVITALLLLPLVLGIVFLMPLNTFALSIAGVLMIGGWEWAGFASRDAAPAERLGYACSVGLTLGVVYMLSPPLTFWPSLSWPVLELSFSNLPLALIALACLFWLLSPLLLWFYPQRAGWWRQSELLRWALGLILLAGLFCALVSLRRIALLNDPVKGALVIFFVLLLVWAADIGAYAAGRLFGRHKLAPAVSPGKTWEGFFGGLLLALVVGHFAAQWMGLQARSEWGLRLLALATVIASVVGDLIESLCKREAGIKDSGRLLPGHGGLLDRIDSLVAAAPVFALGALLLELH